MSNTTTVRVPVRHLRAGDYLTASRTLIVENPFVTARLSSGKRLVHVERQRRGIRREVVLWNASTEMTVERPVR